jgi:hypothetical protein
MDLGKMCNQKKEDQKNEKNHRQAKIAITHFPQDLGVIKSGPNFFFEITIMDGGFHAEYLLAKCGPLNAPFCS